MHRNNYLQSNMAVIEKTFLDGLPSGVRLGSMAIYYQEGCKYSFHTQFKPRSNHGGILVVDLIEKDDCHELVFQARDYPNIESLILVIQNRLDDLRARTNTPLKRREL